MERAREMSGNAAVEKAKRLGRKRKFKIGSPTSFPLANVLPKVDMTSRILTDLFVEDLLSLEDYKTRKNILYEYISGFDEWADEVSQDISSKRGNKSLHYKQHMSDHVKVIYINTQVGLDAFHSFTRCDIMHRALLQALRRGMIRDEDYKKHSDKLNEIIENLNVEIEGLKEYTWKVRNSSSRRKKSKRRSPTKNSSQPN